ncbi:MAG: hypothetical protein WDM87_11805 [Terracidiphilus sp.]
MIVTGFIAEAGGSTGIAYTTSSSVNGSGGGRARWARPAARAAQASLLTAPSLTRRRQRSRSRHPPTSLAPSAHRPRDIDAGSAKYAGISSNPATHQVQ